MRLRAPYLVVAAATSLFVALVDPQHSNSLIRGYAWDVACPVFAYFFVRLTTDMESRFLLAVGCFAVCAIGEVAQLFLKSQMFDVLDSGANALGSLIAGGLDWVTPTSQPRPQESQERKN